LLSNIDIFIDYKSVKPSNLNNYAYFSFPTRADYNSNKNWIAGRRTTAGKGFSRAPLLI